MQTIESEPWQWRRIVFTLKPLWDVEIIDFTNYVAMTQEIGGIIPDTTPIPANPGGIQNGLIRYSRSLEILPDDQLGVVLQDIIQGSAGVDWSDAMIAPLNRSAVTVLSDRKRSIRSGNDSGTMRDFKTWIPLNATMSYQSDETGSFDVQGAFADGGANGLDNVYVLDLFRKMASASGIPARLRVTSTATAYWHER